MQKAEVFNFYLLALSTKGWSPKERRVKKIIILPAKQQVGFEPGTFWSTVECFNQLATVSLQCIETKFVYYSVICNAGTDG